MRMAERFDRIWHNARLASLRGDLPELGVIEHGVIAARDGRIAFAGSRSDFPSDADAAERIDCAGRWITPGLVDCHTHLVSVETARTSSSCGCRAQATKRSRAAGGGIVSTVAATAGSPARLNSLPARCRGSTR
jgi:imidazolonepropionase